MVKERLYIFDVSDIASLLYVCKNCGQEVSYPLDGKYKPNEHCGSCKRPLDRGDPEREVTDPNYAVLTELRRIRNMSDHGVELRFVVPDPDKTRAVKD